jgi:hypothetical protein
VRYVEASNPAQANEAIMAVNSMFNAAHFTVA